MTTPYRKKLIEVAVPLETINREAIREKQNPFLKGHPRSMHHWWARRPLPACRAVLFASLVDDPSTRSDLIGDEPAQERERNRLFQILDDLVKWENSYNEHVLATARAEIEKSVEGKPPVVFDPFCGGGSIPVEAQRLGLEAYASDLNPVAVLVTRSLIESTAKFVGQEPVNPDAGIHLGNENVWPRTLGLAEDVRYYGRWMTQRALESLGALYPDAQTADGSPAPVIGWIWCRTVECPNPACSAEIPLVRSFSLSTKRGKEAYLDPVVNDHHISFAIRAGKGTVQGTVTRQGARCLICGDAVPFDYLRRQSRDVGLALRLLAVICQGQRTRLYLPADAFQDRAAAKAVPKWSPDGEIADNPGHTNVYRYGLITFGDLFTPRQLVGLTTLADLVHEARAESLQDGATEDYADAIATYLGLAVSRLSAYSNSLCIWHNTSEIVIHAFTRQALPMTWDFVEANILTGPVSFNTAVGWVVGTLEKMSPEIRGHAEQLDAVSATPAVDRALVITDPPYYDNIPYADLSDFFYVWLRRSLRDVDPTLFSTVLTPKRSELVATKYRFDGDRAKADAFYETGMARVFEQLREVHDERFPMTLFYAFRQTEQDSGDGSIVSTGWEKMLTGLIGAELMVTATWPMRTELTSALKKNMSALASSVVIACRPRPVGAPIATRRELGNALRIELPVALRQFQHVNIAPVDLAQAAIGPGMAVFTRYAKVLEAEGRPMTVRSALALINQTLDEILAEQEGDFDADTRFALTWFEQRGFDEGPFGEADVLARAKDTSTRGLEEAGVLSSRAGKVRLLRREELNEDWNPVTDRRPTVWEAAQHLVRRLETGGEGSAADLVRVMGGVGETARELAYRLYTTAERKGWAQEALAYNALVVSWPEIQRLATEAPTQSTLEV